MDENRVRKCILFDDFDGDPIISKARSLFASLCPDADESSRNAAESDAERFAADVSDYCALQKAMSDLIGREDVVAGYWQNYVCKLIGSSDNAFSRMAEKGAFAAFETSPDPDAPKAPAPSDAERAIFALAVEELQAIRRVYMYDFDALERAISKRAKGSFGAENIAKVLASPVEVSRRQLVHEALSSASARTATARLARYHRAFGAGAFEGFDAFQWKGSLRGAPFADPIVMDDLIGCESQKRALIENTEFLLRGLPSNNVLLCGDSGTGKSSSVKALLNMFKDRGLKLIDLPKERIGALPDILELVSGRGLKFIIFIDDLSFEENEVGYKSFKSVIEGSVGAGASNAVICVTSNRRNIVKEVWKDREAQEDIHLRDNLQEKRSLADRFGLTLVYSSPEKREYLEIVLALAKKSGLRADEERIKAEALVWEIRRGGRSGRAARQFINHMIGIEALEALERKGDANP